MPTQASLSPRRLAPWRARRSSLRAPLRGVLLSLATLAAAGCNVPGFDLGYLDGDLGGGSAVDSGAPGDGGARDLGRGPDLGCPGSPCDVVCQNCGAGQKCTLDSGNKNACLGAGAAQMGQSCGKKGDDCAAGLVCLGVSQAGASACFRFCHSDADCPGGGACGIAISGSSQSACTEAVTHCTPVPQAGCGAGTSCYVVTASGDTGCHLAGPGGGSATCASDYDCQPGYACFQSPPGCQPLCRIGVNADCPVNKICVPVAGWTGAYGSCQ